MSAPATPVRPRPGAGERGFSFIEILVVMGIIAVLAGMVVLAINIIARKGPEQRTRVLLNNLSATTDHWKRKFGAYPPTDFQQLTLYVAPSLKIPKAPNTTNLGIESLYQALHLHGFGTTPSLRDPASEDDLGEGDLSNTDDDGVDKSFNIKDSTRLYEIRDGWGNPLVYFASAQYASADKDPPIYICGADDAPESDVRPRPWRSPTGGFAKPDSYQLFSMGPDGVPNTEDDLKAWEN